MAQFKAFAPQVEVSGDSISALVEGMGAFKPMGLQVLAEHGILEPQPGKWYPKQAYLDGFKKIADKLGVATLKGIGKKIPEKAAWPPNVNSIASALASIDVAYHMNHRGGEIGHYRFEKTGEKSGKMVCQNPYPCAFDQGIVEAAAKKFAPAGALVKVTHDDTRPCRQKGGESCTYLVSW
jgi:hypothetical protein